MELFAAERLFLIFPTMGPDPITGVLIKRKTLIQTSRETSRKGGSRNQGDASTRFNRDYWQSSEGKREARKNSPLETRGNQLAATFRASGLDLERIQQISTVLT